jgi:membrane protein
MENKEVRVVEAHLKRLIRSIFNAIKQNDLYHYGYRAASISFYVILSFFPILIVLATLLSFYQDLFSDIVSNLLSFYPSIPLTDTQIMTVVSSVMTEQRGVWGLFSFAVTYLLSSTVFAVFYRSLLILFNLEDSSKRHWFIRLVSIPTVLMALLFLRLSLSLILIVFNWIQTLSFLSPFVSVLFFETSVVVISNLVSFSVVIILFLAYHFLVKRACRRMRSSLLVSLLVSLILLLVSKSFVWGLSYLVTLNPVYAAFGGVLGLFSWIYCLLMVTLVGARVLYLYEQKSS